MKRKPLYIFDLDGTLALIEHRRHYVECARDQQDWVSFYHKCVDDKPNTNVLIVLESLRIISDIWIFSGRSDVVRTQTIDWLAKHTSFTHDDFNYVGNDQQILTMRSDGDYTKDDDLKRQWYQSMLQYDKDRLVGVFDDRNRVVEMWRSMGVQCFQVAKGDF